MMERRLLLISAALAGTLVGCTYMDQKADLQSGGPQRREADALARQQAAQDKQRQLFDQRQAVESDAASVREELEAAEQELEQVSRDLQTISNQLEQARRRNAISEAEYRRLKSDLNKANFQAAAAQLDTGAGSGSAAAQKKQQIEALQKQKSQLEQALSQSVRP